MKYKLKANSSGQFYFPKRIRETWGHELELVPNLRSGIIYPAGVSACEVLESLHTILPALDYLAKLENKEKARVKTQDG